jgi:hypothetical protein
MAFTHQIVLKAETVVEIMVLHTVVAERLSVVIHTVCLN